MGQEILRTIQVLIFFFTVGALATVAIIYTRDHFDQVRLNDAVTECFDVASYTVTDPATNATSEEPIERYFQSCMEFKGYGDDFEFRN